MTNESESLHGAGIVVTRPEGRGEALCRRVEAAGGNALFFPAMEIRPLPEPHLPSDTAPDWLIFTSLAAVEHGLQPLGRQQSGKTRVAAIGNGTASSLQSAGWRVDVVPARQESEGLLAMSAFEDLQGQDVWIVRGRGGREMLADSLRERGARVQFVEVYARALPTQGAEPLLEWWRQGRVDAVVVSSRAGLENLHALLDAEGRRYLQASQLVVPTVRMLKLALELDVRPAPVVAEGASDDAFMAALTKWWRERRQDSR